MLHTVFARVHRIAPALIAVALCSAAAPPRAWAARKPAASAQAASSAPAQPQTLVRRLCDALHSLPEARKIECCKASPTGSLASACTQSLASAIEHNAVSLDATEVERCATESAEHLQGCDWVTPLMPRLPPACQGIVHGRLDRGSRCQSSLECKNGLSCLGSGNGTPGICAAPSPPGVRCGGGPDLLESYARQTGADPRHPQCAGFCRNGRCAAPLAVGDACSSNEQCIPGNRCQAGRCTDGLPPKRGEACDGTTCDGDLVCLDGRCTPPKRAGEPCSKPFECEATCLTPKGATTGTCGMRCTAWPPAGYTAPQYSPADRAQAKSAK